MTVGRGGIGAAPRRGKRRLGERPLAAAGAPPRSGGEGGFGGGRRARRCHRLYVVDQAADDCPPPYPCNFPPPTTHWLPPRARKRSLLSPPTPYHQLSRKNPTGATSPAPPWALGGGRSCARAPSAPSPITAAAAAVRALRANLVFTGAPALLYWRRPPSCCRLSLPSRPPVGILPPWPPPWPALQRRWGLSPASPRQPAMSLRGLSLR